MAPVPDAAPLYHHLVFTLRWVLAANPHSTVAAKIVEEKCFLFSHAAERRQHERLHSRAHLCRQVVCDLLIQLP